jgi:uncharacterized protein (DUF2237 family)
LIILQVYGLFNKLADREIFKVNMQKEIALNVFGEPLTPCSFDPLTGFFRDGCCKTNEEDVGSHLVCAIVTDEFLQFSLERGNDLITPRPEYRFPGLVAGDQWCLCINRWVEAFNAKCAPFIKLESTHLKSLETVPLSILKEFAREV